MKKLSTLTSLLIFATLMLFSACTSNDDNDSTTPKIVIRPGAGAERIYLVGTGDNATLQLTKEQNYICTYFQFGGVIGYDANDDLIPIFNPTTSFIDTWITNWDSDALHSVANLKAGKGDPCRLVGYKASEVRDMLAANILPDNGLWRTPTLDENVDFATGGFCTGWSTVNGFNGHYFPTATSTSNWLPASGARLDVTGQICYVGSRGLAWSSSFNGNAGYTLRLQDTFVANANSHNRAWGFPVRCIK